MLVVEAQGRSHRFPAMPEPPSLSGAVPGTWRISFSVPAAMAPDLGARTWLQLGAVVAPLPPAVEPVPSATTEAMPATPEDADQPPESSPEAEIIIARRLRSSELALESARLREGEARASAAQLAQQIRELEQRLEGERSESTRLAAALSGHERARRSAEQRAHAETELRIELEDRLGARERDRQLARRALGDLAAAEERLRELERELEGLRRRADEAEQAAAAAQAARVRAQRQAGDAARSGTSAAPGPPGPDHAGVTRSRLLERERELVALRARQPRRVASEPAPAPGTAAPAADESAVAVGSVAAVGPATADESAVTVESVAAVGPAAADESAVTVESVAAVGPATVESVAAVEPAAVEPATVNAAEAPQAAIDALRREVDMRAATEARLRAELITTRGRLEARLAIESSLSLTLSELRGELERLQSAVTLEGAARVQSERRAAQLEHDLLAQRERADRAYQSIEDLRQSLSALRAARAAPPKPASTSPPAPAGDLASAGDLAAAADPARPVQPQRLNEALSRLRETIPAQVPPGEPEAGAAHEAGAAGVGATGAGAAPAEPAEAVASGRVWLEPVFRSLVRRDAALGGRLLLDLLPAQRAAYPRPVAYDLVLGEHRCVQVTVFGGPPEIRFADAQRPASVTDFRAVGDAARLARLLVAGRIRARLGIGVARVRGRRDALSALRALVQAPLALSELQRAGVRLEPALALEVAALMIAPQWTAGERFSIAHEQDGRSSSLLHVRDGLPPAVSQAWPADRADTTIACPAELLLDVLSGHDPQGLEVSGDERPLGLLRDWLKRAQSG